MLFCACHVIPPHILYSTVQYSTVHSLCVGHSENYSRTSNFSSCQFDDIPFSILCSHSHMMFLSPLIYPHIHDTASHRCCINMKCTLFNRLTDLTLLLVFLSCAEGDASQLGLFRLVGHYWAPLLSFPLSFTLIYGPGFLPTV